MKKWCELSIESSKKTCSACRSAAETTTKSTIFEGLTNKSLPDTIRVLLTKNGGLQYVI